MIKSDMLSFTRRILAMFLVIRWRCVLFIVAINILQTNADDGVVHRHAFLEISYTRISRSDARLRERITEKKESGIYAEQSRQETEWGVVRQVRSQHNTRNGCLPILNVPTDRWIALIERGGCAFITKITNAAVESNASAVIIYNDRYERGLLTMEGGVEGVVSVFINRSEGLRIEQLAPASVRITPGRFHANKQLVISNTTTATVSITFILLLVIVTICLIIFAAVHCHKRRLDRRITAAPEEMVYAHKSEQQLDEQKSGQQLDEQKSGQQLDEPAFAERLDEENKPGEQMGSGQQRIDVNDTGEEAVAGQETDLMGTDAVTM